MPEKPERRISIIFRALNEAEWFDDALRACESQQLDADYSFEIILVDSGSADATLDIAAAHNCRIVHIKKSDFTFGRSLNYGCEVATGDVLVFISAHCIPEHDRWLMNLVQPIYDGLCDYAYGRQIGHDISRFSETQVFEHYYGLQDKLPQEGFFCNNANSAIRADLWRTYRFDEEVTGLEDMVLAKAVKTDGGKIGYVASAPVVHIHQETLAQVKRRYYREALTMREIVPEVHFHLGDLTRCFFAGVFSDFSEAVGQRSFFREAFGIVLYRMMQYWGTYSGHNEHRALSRAQKESYYYPRSKKQRSKDNSILLDSKRAAKTNA